MHINLANWSVRHWASLGIGVLVLAGLAAWGIAQTSTPASPENNPVATVPTIPATSPVQSTAAPVEKNSKPRVEVNGPGHPVPERLLAVMAGRLHQEALQHFYSDPRNGFSRMPVVYEKVVKEWKTPWWSPGELDQATPVPFLKDLQTIHGDTTTNFLTAPDKLPDAATLALPLVRLRGSGKSDRRHLKNWEVKNVDLIGLLFQTEPVVYISDKLPEAKKTGGVTTRPLDAFEMAGLDALRGGENLFVRSRDGVVQVLGAVRARQDCLKCHPGSKTGDLLGAFSYTVREAEYQRQVGFRKLDAPAATIPFQQLPQGKITPPVP